MKIIATFAFLFLVNAAFAQRDLLELVRADLQTEAKMIVMANIGLDESRSDIFWPIYDEFALAVKKNNDQRLAVIKDYAENYENLTGEKAEQLINEALSLQAERNKLLKTYFKKVKKALDAKTAARFVQIENQLMALVDLQIGQMLPLAY